MKKYDENYLMNEWVCPQVFPIILHLVVQYEDKSLNINEVYNLLDEYCDKAGYSNYLLYERLNFAYFLRNKKFPNNFKTIDYKVKQGSEFKQGICMMSQPEYNNTIIYKENDFILVRV